MFQGDAAVAGAHPPSPHSFLPPGSSALLELLAFKSTRHRSTLGLGREVEKIGANIMANASREQVGGSVKRQRSGGRGGGKRQVPSSACAQGQGWAWGGQGW